MGKINHDHEDEHSDGAANRIIRRRPIASMVNGKTQQPTARIWEEKSERPISAYISRKSTLFCYPHLPKFDHRWLPSLWHLLSLFSPLQKHPFPFSQYSQYDLAILTPNAQHLHCLANQKHPNLGPEPTSPQPPPFSGTSSILSSCFLFGCAIQDHNNLSD